MDQISGQVYWMRIGPDYSMKILDWIRIPKISNLCKTIAHKGGPAGCTTGRASGLHKRRTGGLHIKLGCRKRRAGGQPISAGWPVLFRSQPDRPFVQPAGPPFCLLCSLSPPKIHVSHLETRPSRCQSKFLTCYCFSVILFLRIKK